MPVCQSIWVAKVDAYSLRRRPPGTVESGMANSRRWSLVASLMVMLLAQFHRPTRSGVCRLMADWRLALNRATVSSAAPVPGNGSSVGGPEWNDCWFVNENPGDQVMSGVMLTGEGVRVTPGKLWVTAPLERSWERLPPTFSAPQSNRLLKFNCDDSCAVAR